MEFGLIGAGRIGHLRAKALQQLANVKLAAVFDLDQQRAAQVAAPARARICKDITELLRADTLDAVIVSTPPPIS